MYEERLKDSRWISKSKAIKQRDNFRCTKCRSSKRIQVHHKVYVSGRKPWEYDDRYLVTLCNECHEKEHADKHISEFVTRDKKIIRDINPVKKTKKQKQYKKKWMRDAMAAIEFLKQ